MHALITGASTGLGKEFARIHAARGGDLTIVARSSDKLNALKEELESTYGISVTVIAKDLSTPQAAKELFEATKDSTINILINNAGFGLKGSFLETELKRNTEMVTLNITTLMELCHLFGNKFTKENGGKILNIASIASFFPGPKQPVYYASKAFVRSFSRALAYTLHNTNTSVTVLNPGATKTEFFANAKAAEFTQGDDATQVALAGYDAMMSGRAELTYGVGNKILAHLVSRILPTAWQVWILDHVSEI